VNDPHHDLIAELERDLEPVRPVAPLRRVIGLLGVLWAGIVGVAALVQGVRPDLEVLLATPFGQGGIFAGLILAGVAGVVAALALAIPGRERAARAALALGLAGIAWAAAVGVRLFVTSPLLASTGAADLHCLGVAFGMALLPALGIVAFGARAAPFRPLVLVLAAAASTAALGAAAAQTSCPLGDAGHLLRGHVFGPALAALLLTLPLLVALRRLRASRSS